MERVRPLHAPNEFGRLGYDTPVAQPTTFQLKPLHTNAESTFTTADCISCISAEVLALSHTDDPGGDTDDMILEVAPPTIGAPSVTSPLLLRLFQRHLRRMSPLL